MLQVVWLAKSVLQKSDTALIVLSCQCLLNLSSAIDTLNSLQEFYDTVEGHVRSLTTLGKKVESYGNLLVAIIRSRLPPITWKNIARDHGSGEWTLVAMQAAIKKEIQTCELEVQSPQIHSLPTASFLTAAPKQTTLSDRTSSNLVYFVRAHMSQMSVP